MGWGLHELISTWRQGRGASPLEELRSSRVRFARTSKLFEFLMLTTFAPRTYRCSSSLRSHFPPDGSRAPFLRTFGAHAPVLAPSVLKLLPGRQSHSRTVALRTVAPPVSPSHLTVLQLRSVGTSHPPASRTPLWRYPVEIRARVWCPTHCSSGHPRLGSCWPPPTTRMQRSKPPGRPAKPGPPSISGGAFQKNVFQDPRYSSVRASAAVSSSSISAYS
ncbi:hypothetical protein DSECCO2_47200 [anaerobic digester metagenome]|jgi:hypothetical protein